MRRFSLAFALLSVAAANASDDVTGSEDTDLFERFPRSWIVDYEATNESRSYTFVIGPVEKIRREVRIEDVARVDGKLTQITYRLPDGTRLDEAIAHTQAQLDSKGWQGVFTCNGRDCGRSAVWANDVFRVASLASPNSSQFYAASVVRAGDDTRLLSAYVVQRGNRRVYIHMDLVESVTGLALTTNEAVPEQLARSGIAVIESVVPRDDGTIPADGMEKIDAVAAALNRFDTVYAVCHVYGSKQPEALLEASTRCAAVVAERLVEQGVDALPFGAGPFAPRDTLAVPRVELVVPRLLRGD